MSDLSLMSWPPKELIVPVNKQNVRLNAVSEFSFVKGTFQLIKQFLAYQNVWLRWRMENPMNSR